MKNEELNLGACCVCGGNRRVRNIIMLSKRTPYGHGWGCFQCGLPMEGATIVVCDSCLKKAKRIDKQARWFCKPDENGNYSRGRAPIAELENAPVFAHDMSKHPGEE